MALSNWDTLAIDLDGKPVNGVFVSPKTGIKVELYKNWVYIHDTKGWREGGRFVNDTVAEIQEGDLSIHDIHIRAIRGPQNGIFVACWTVEWPKSETGETKPIYKGMIGCGVYGFEGGDWIGVSKESFKFLQDWISKKEPVFDEDDLAQIIEHFKEADDKSRMAEDIRDLTPEQYKAKLKSEMTYNFDKQIATVDFSKALRFCQGDGYFEDRLGEDRSGTPVGEADEPILMKLFGNAEPSVTNEAPIQQSADDFSDKDVS